MWSEFLEDPKSFRNKIITMYANRHKQDTTNQPQQLLSVLPEWLDTKDFEVDYRPNQKLLIFFTNSKTPFLTGAAPVVFEVKVMESYYQNKKLKGKMMDIFRILQVWVPDKFANEWINLKENELYVQPKKIGDNYQIQVADQNLMSLMSQDSAIWHEVTIKNDPTFLPVTWKDIASFAARQSARKYHGNGAMKEKIYLNIYTKVPGGSWQAINKKKVI